MTQRGSTSRETNAVGTGALRPPPAPSHAREWIVLVMLGAYALIVALATLTPTPLDQGFESSVDRVLAVLHRHGVPDWFGYNTLEFSANIVMFLPLAFLISLLMPFRWWWLAFLAAPALSVAIELTQHALLDARFATANDVIANSTGAVIGTLLAHALRSVVRARDKKVVALALWREHARMTGVAR
jgi:glycopeptide antibiotics resistance protein